MADKYKKLHLFSSKLWCTVITLKTKQIYYSITDDFTYEITHGYIYQHIYTDTNGQHFPDDIFKNISLEENCYAFIQLSLKFVFKG